MAFGAEIYGAHGRLQLGESVSNYYMVEKGTITQSTWGDQSFNRNLYGPSGPWWNASEGAVAKMTAIPATLPYDFVALGGLNIAFAPAMVGSYDGSDGSGGGYAITCGPASGSRTLYWYTFRSYTKLTPETSGYGMEIINPATGQVNFSLRYPKILKTLAKYDYNEFTTHSLPTGKTLAFIGFGEVWREEQYSDNPETGLMSWYPSLNITLNNSNGMNMVRGTDTAGLQASSARTSSERSDGGVICIDVTGY